MRPCSARKRTNIYAREEETLTDLENDDKPLRRSSARSSLVVEREATRGRRGSEQLPTNGDSEADRSGCERTRDRRSKRKENRGIGMPFLGLTSATPARELNTAPGAVH